MVAWQRRQVGLKSVATRGLLSDLFMRQALRPIAALLLIPTSPICFQTCSRRLTTLSISDPTARTPVQKSANARTNVDSRRLVYLGKMFFAEPRTLCVTGFGKIHAYPSGNLARRVGLSPSMIRLLLARQSPPRLRNKAT